MVIEKKFGVIEENVDINQYCISNNNGMEVTVTQIGVSIVSIMVPDKNGHIDDVVLGYDDPNKYYYNWTCMGGVIGRHANRIDHASFKLEGKRYKLKKNGQFCNLHSGYNGYQTRVWNTEKIDSDSNSVEFSLNSPDMDQGFPGNLHVSVTYMLNDNNELIIKYTGISDQDTIINLTNHSYFNLAGHQSGEINNHLLKLYSDKVTNLNRRMIPTGKISSVINSPLDFTRWKRIGEDIDKDMRPFCYTKGYDTNYVLSMEKGEIKKAASLYEPGSGRSMEVFTDLPGLQLYSANAMETHVRGKDGAQYKGRNAICFETQFFPNAIREKTFESPIIRKDEKFVSKTIFRFGWDGEVDGKE